MKMLKALLLPFVLFGVTSCIDAAPRDTTPKIPWRQELINDWTGKAVSRIIAKWGAPDKSLHIAGREYVVYVDEGTRSGGSQRYGSAYSYSYVGCTWTLEIKNGIIVGGNAVGPTCDNK